MKFVFSLTTRELDETRDVSDRQATPRIALAHASGREFHMRLKPNRFWPVRNGPSSFVVRKGKYHQIIADDNAHTSLLPYTSNSLRLGRRVLT